MSNKLIDIIEKIKKENKQLNEYIYICPDDRKHIETGNIVKYIDINNLKKIKTGKVIKITLDKLTLKSLNSNIVWTIKFANNHIFYKFYKDHLIDAINELLEKNEKNV
jgi:hypothetical protein